MTQIQGFMITNGGEHPADMWADKTTDSILALLIDANPDANTPEAAAARQAKRDLRPVLFNIFMSHHDGVQKHERGHLTKNVKHADKGREHVEAQIDVAPHLSVMDQVHAALAATPFAAHFAQPRVRHALHQIVGQDLADIMHIERRYHQDRLNAAKGA